MSSDRTYWFPAKRYGWGWGPPSVWQGWLVLAVFTGLLIAGPAVVPPQANILGYLAYTAVWSGLLIAVCWLKGEPPRGRWGNDGTGKP